MKKKLIIKLSIISIFLFYSTLLFAQTEKKESFFTSFGVGARAYVLKASYVSIADDYAATHWNPAGIAFINKIQVGGMHSNLSFNRQIEFISFILPIDETNKIGLSWKGLLNNRIPARSTNSVMPDYFFRNTEQAFVLTYSRRFFNSLSFGVNIDFLHQSLDNVNASGWGMDFGLMYQLNRGMKFGFVVYDFNSHLKWSTGHTDFFKKISRLGFSYQLTPNSLMAIGLEGKNQFSASSEFHIMEPLCLRMGLQDQFLSLGAGIKFNLSNLELNFNYAVTNHKLADQLSHIFDLTILFNSNSNKDFRLAETKSGKLKVHSRSEIKYEKVAVKAGRLNVRSGPGIKYKKIAVVLRGQRFFVLGRKSKWIKIKYAEKRTGWIKEDYAKIINS